MQGGSPRGGQEGDEKSSVQASEQRMLQDGMTEST